MCRRCGYDHGFTGVILAGGASRRMGQDKAKLDWGGTTLLDHMKHLLLDAGAKAVTVLGRNDFPDRQAFAGPALALADYLANTQPDSRHLVVPVDMPGLSEKLLRLLAKQRGWTHFDGFPLPLMATGGPCASPKRIRDLLAAQQAVTLPVPPDLQSCFANINTPDDFDRWTQTATYSQTGNLSHV